MPITSIFGNLCFGLLDYTKISDVENKWDERSLFKLNRILKLQIRAKIRPIGVLFWSLVAMNSL